MRQVMVQGEDGRKEIDIKRYAKVEKIPGTILAPVSFGPSTGEG